MKKKKEISKIKSAIHILKKAKLLIDIASSILALAHLVLKIWKLIN